MIHECLALANYLVISPIFILFSGIINLFYLLRYREQGHKYLFIKVTGQVAGYFPL